MLEPQFESHRAATICLKNLLLHAERMYGPRAAQVVGDIPVYVAPGMANAPVTIFNPQTNRFQVYVTVFRSSSDPQSLYQLSHEAIHCLNGTFSPDTTFFEEGLAVSHALRTVQRLDKKYATHCRTTLGPRWQEAFKAYSAIPPFSHILIKKLRQEVPQLNQVQPADLEKALSVNGILAAELCRRLPVV